MGFQGAFGLVIIGDMKTNTTFALALATVALMAGGCASMYYGTMEKFGKEKRDILVDRVDDARTAQTKAAETFKDALEQFGSVVNYDGGDLRKQYDKMSSQLEKCEGRAKEVTSRIDSIEKVAGDLFREWANEAKSYQNAEFRRSSEAQLSETKADYSKMISAMRNAESKIEPVLVVFRDQTLYLKHNLNARAIASLQSESGKISTDVNALIAELTSAIAEADRFIAGMDK